MRVSPSREHAFGVGVCRPSKVPIPVIEQRGVLRPSSWQVLESALVGFGAHWEVADGAISLLEGSELS